MMGDTKLNESPVSYLLLKKWAKYMRYCRVESSKQSTYKIIKQLLMTDDQMKDD